MSVKYEVVSFQTKDKIKLNGLLSVPKDPKGVCVYVHGIFDDAFNSLGRELAEILAKEGFGTLLFNNRGAGVVSSFTKQEGKKSSYVSLGTAYEEFADCTQDLDSAVSFLQQNKIKYIHLIGHSTGCQKSVYYLSQLKSQSRVKSALLLAPVSDYSVAIKDPLYKEKVDHARYLSRVGRKSELLTDKHFNELLSAQRFLSLYTPESKEEIFTYASGKKAKTLKSVTVPTLVVFGEKDEYLDRPVLELVEWFEENISAKKKLVEWVEGANHSFKGKEKELGKIITSWLSAF